MQVVSGKSQLINVILARREKAPLPQTRRTEAPDLFGDSDPKNFYRLEMNVSAEGVSVKIGQAVDMAPRTVEGSTAFDGGISAQSSAQIAAFVSAVIRFLTC